MIEYFVNVSNTIVQFCIENILNYSWNYSQLQTLKYVIKFRASKNEMR